MKNDMNKRIHRAFKTNEIYVFLTIIAVTLIIEVISGQFYTPNNLVDIVRSFIPSALFSIGLVLFLFIMMINVFLNLVLKREKE